jgi:amidase
MQLTCIAGLAGLPQITVPILKKDGMVLGLSFIANKNLDRSLLAFVRQHFGGNIPCN